MPYQLKYTHGPAMAVVEVSALAFAETAEPVLREIASRTRDRHDRRLLINLLDVVGTMSPDEHRAIGVLAARHLSHLEKVASLVPEDKITRVSEAAAQAAGMQLKVFTNLTEAVGWLLE
jgi:SpoIIAA-like